MSEYVPPVSSSLPCRVKLLQHIWSLIRAVVFTCSPFFARRWRVLWVKLFSWLCTFQDSIAMSASIARTARIDFPWNVRIGHRVTIDESAWLYGLDNIVIEDLAIIGRHVKVLTGSHDLSSQSFALVTKPVLIKRAAWIATGAIILPGISVGEGAVVGAGAVVTTDVPPWRVVAGNPARIIGSRKLIKP